MLPAPSFAHLLRLTDRTGVLEHARLLLPRRAHGYTTDDTARALIAACREPAADPGLVRLTETCLAFLEHARRPDGTYHNRLSYDRRWVDVRGSSDCHGRALWALGTAAAAAPNSWLRQGALSAFRMSRAPEGDWLRSHAFAVLGAAAVLEVDPGDEAAAGLLAESARYLARSRGGRWPWPEERLAYDNARLAEALLAAGGARSDAAAIEEGLELLEWLVGLETRDGHFSVTPAGGWAPGEPRPGFDQQPVEVAALADACSRAWDLTGDPVWAARVGAAAAWLLGDNDTGVPLYDPASGACADGLRADGVNANSGAESTIAAILVMQQAQRVSAPIRLDPVSRERGTV